MNLQLLIYIQGLIGVLLFVGTLLTPPIYAQQPQSQEFLTWNEPQGDFSIEYPSDWTVEEKVNRFDETDVTFISPLSAINGYVGVIYGDTTTPEYNELKELGFDETEIMERVFGFYIDGFSPTIDNFREVEDRDFSRYTVNGHLAASVVFAGEIYGQELGGLLVLSFVDDRMFNLVFGSNQDEFDRILPKVEHMISSIQIPAAAEGVVLEDEGQLGNGENEVDVGN